MRLLFEIDTKDYDPNGTRYERPSARGIIVRDGKIAMVYSRRYDYYKLPGGGIEAGETPREAVVREVREETGLAVIPESIREYGWVHRIQKGENEDVFVQDNYYFLCEAGEEQGDVRLEADEVEEDFVPVFVTPEKVIAADRAAEQRAKRELRQVMFQREVRVLEMLMQEGIL